VESPGALPSPARGEGSKLPSLDGRGLGEGETESKCQASKVTLTPMGERISFPVTPDARLSQNYQIKSGRYVLPESIRDP
jgi:hypothetical protein